MAYQPGIGKSPNSILPSDIPALYRPQKQIEIDILVLFDIEHVFAVTSS